MVHEGRLVMGNNRMLRGRLVYDIHQAQVMEV